MKLLWNKYGAKLIAIFIIIAVVTGVVSVIAIFAGFIMKIFGFEYTSVWSMIWFFLVATVLSYPIGMFAKAVPDVLLNGFHRITLGQARFLYVFFDTIATAVGLMVADKFMESISATDTAIFVASFVLALFSRNDIEEKGD